MPHVSRTPRAILVDVIPPEMNNRTAKRRLLELESLTKTYGGLVIVELIQRRAVPDYRTYLGKGKLEEIIALGEKEKVEVLIINNALKPGQMFHVEETLRQAKSKMHVWDRIDLILNIFTKHAKTAEAKLQIKLAALKHMGPRIFGMGQEMMQQMGGVGGRGGQGESNTEMMKRHLANQEKQVEKELERVAASRELHRKRRDRIGLKTVSIIGYTNAGKSSLLNALTKKGAYVANALFATLDTRVGKLYLEAAPQTQILSAGLGSAEEQGMAYIGSTPSSTGGTDNASRQNMRPPREVLLSDTIGFIQDLPPQLIHAFRSTLDETVDADVLLHVIDVADPFVHEKIAEVEGVLKAIHADHIPKIYVFNKTDAKKRIGRATLTKRYKTMTPVFVSAVTSDGLEELKGQIRKRIASQAN